MKVQRIEHQKAIELGKALAESLELQRLRKAQAELQLDKEADRLYRQLRANNDIKGDGREVHVGGMIQSGLEERIMENPIINELISAQQEFSKLMKDINGIIGFYVTGKENIELKRDSCNRCNGCKG